MKKELAMNLIADQMGWDHKVATKEFDELEMMVNYKYDHYQGFQPGSRFYLALIGWLNQFNTVEKRQIAYDFLKNRLLFFSQREMHHLISLLMPIIDRSMRTEVAKERSVPLYQTWLDAGARRRVDLMLMRTLFIALSDGARIDVFRRFNEGLVSNEQVLAYSEISESKWQDLLNELEKTLLAQGYKKQDAYFERICLIDDFTGSGSSLIRNANGVWKGKIKRFTDLYCKLMNTAPTPVFVQVHHHLASAKACDNINRDLADFSKTQERFQFVATYSYQLPQSVVIEESSQADLVSLLQGHYDTNVEDDHSKNVLFGYGKSGLPLVLEHNTPNNSIGLLWAESPKNMQPNTHHMTPLFIRRKRHSSHHG